MGRWMQIHFDFGMDILDISVNQLPEDVEAEIKGRLTWLKNTETALARYLDDDDLRPLAMEIIDRLHDHMQNKL
jgi:hypothetical protein